MRRWGFLNIALIISLLHSLAAAGTFVLGFSIGLKRWDSGPPQMLESAANAVAEVLLQPGIRFLRVGLPGELEWAIVVANSILWGIVGATVLVLRRLSRGR